MNKKTCEEVASIGLFACVVSFFIVACVMFFGNSCSETKLLDVDIPEDVILYVNDTIMYSEVKTEIRNYSQNRGGRSLIVHAFDKMRAAGLDIDGNPVYTYRNDTCFVTFTLFESDGKATALYVGEGYKELIRIFVSYD